MAYKMTSRRKLAIASWGPPTDPNIYGKLTVDATKALAYVEKLRRETGEKVTISHLVGKAVALALAQAPTLNGRILFGRYIPHETVDLSFLVAMETHRGEDLAMTKLSQVDKLAVVDITRKIHEGANRLRSGKDDDFEKSKPIIKLLPDFLLRRVVKISGWLSGALGITLKPLGLKAFPFGAAVLTNVGTFGLDEAWVPQTPFAHVPVWVLIGAVKEKPAVVDGKIVVQPQLSLCATVDHRFIDGAQGAVLAKVVRDVLENPEKLDAAPAALPAPAPAAARSAASSAT